MSQHFINLTPLSLLISCKLSFPIVSLKMSSLPTLTLKSCTPTKSNLYFDSSLDTAIRSLPYTNFLHSIIQISYPHSITWVVYPKNPYRSEALYKLCKDIYFLRWRVVSQRTTPYRLSAAAYPIYSQLPLHSWRPFLHPQPENAPCSGDRDPPNNTQ
jgi:hypothetical protein